MNQTDLLEQVRIYSEALVEDLPEPTGDRQIDVMPTRRSPRTSGAWVGVSAAALVVVLFGVVPLLFNNILPASGIDSYQWSRVPYDDAAFGEGFEQGMEGVTVGGPGLVAVGQAGAPTGAAAVWTSVDGISWSRVTHDGEVFNGGVMHSVTTAGPGLVAVGTSDQAAVWASPDGYTWSRIPHDSAVFGSESSYTAMNSVAAFGSGVVAVGISSDFQVEDVKAVVWISPDGINWSRIPHDPAVFQSESMNSVVAGGPGLVAVGTSVWTSVDGITWSRVRDSEALRDGPMNSVAAGGPGLVAVGSDDRGAAVWTSPDGVNWSRIPDDQGVFGNGEMSSVTAIGSDLVAVGRKDRGAAVWTSPDGINWSRVPHDERIFETEKADLPDLQMSDVTALGSRLVVVGANRWPDEYSTSLTRSEAAVWVATPGG